MRQPLKIVGVFRHLVAGDHRCWLERLERVERGDPFTPALRVGLGKIGVNAVVDDVPGHDAANSCSCIALTISRVATAFARGLGGEKRVDEDGVPRTGNEGRGVRDPHQMLFAGRHIATETGARTREHIPGQGGVRGFDWSHRGVRVVMRVLTCTPICPW
jgi:hypothetical protein